MRTPTRRRVRRLRDNPEGQMTILEHLTELRDRLLRCVLALFIITTTVAFVVVYEPVLRFVTKSYCTIPAKYRVATAGGGCRLLALSPPGPDRHPHPGRPHGRGAAVPVDGREALLPGDAQGVAGGGGDHHRGGGGDHPQPGPHQPVRHGDPHVDLLVRRRRGRQVAHRAGPRPPPRPTRASHQHAVGALITVASHRSPRAGPRVADNGPPEGSRRRRAPGLRCWIWLRRRGWTRSGRGSC